MTAKIVKCGFVRKIWQWKNGYFALSGGLHQYRELFDYLNNDCKGKDGPKGRFQALVWNSHDQIMYEAVNNLGFYVAALPAAIGSGDVAAFAAMACGQTAEEAIEIAAKIDTGTGGPVQKIALRKKKHGIYSPNYSRLALQPAV